MRSFRLNSPACPTCGMRDARLVKSPGNLARVAWATVCALVIGVDPTRPVWGRRRDGTRFRGSGTAG